MAIVKMKKLRVMAMADHRDELLKGLLHLGCVEISEPDDKLADPAWSALLKRGTSRLAETKSEITEVNTALDAIKRFAQPKDGLFAPGERSPSRSSSARNPLSVLRKSAAASAVRCRI